MNELEDPAGALASVVPDRTGFGPSAVEVPMSSELAALYEHASLGFAVFDTQLRFLRINDRLADINGLPASEHLGKRVHDILPGLVEQAEASLRHVLETGTALRNVEISGDTPAAPGVVRTWLEQWTPIRDRRGDIVAVSAVVEETTALRRLAQENRQVAGALAASEARHEFLVRLHDQMRLIADPQELAYLACCLLGEHLHLSRVSVAEFDADGRTMAVRKHYADGVPYSDGRHDPSEFGEGFVATLRTGRTIIEADVRGAGSLGDAERHAHLRRLTEAFVVVPVFETGRLAAMFFVNSRFARDWSRDEISLIEAVAERAYDAMQRARAAQQLRENEQRLRLAQEAAGLGIFDSDLVTGARRWGERMHVLWGFAADEPLTTEALRAMVPPEDLPGIDAAMARAMDPADGGSVTFEHRVRRKSDGREIRILLTVQAHFRAGVPVRMVGAVQDITALREAELALRDADLRKDEFLAMLAHELRNPLAPLRNALRYVERCDIPAHCHAPLQMATRQVQHMTRLVEDLLEVSRISRGIIRMRPEPVMVQQALFAVAEALSPTLEERHQSLEYDLPRTSLWVEADPTRLAQVIENLVSNASKYSEPGGTVTLRSGRQDNEVFIAVSDDGIGIAPENLSRVFELFTQVNEAIDRSNGGLGIGLALVKRLVDAQGGRVAAASEGLGMGTTFTVWLPARNEAAR